MPFIDFDELKQRVSIEQAAKLLGLEIAQKSNHALRAPCPACQTGGDRALAITPAKGLFYCFAADKGGDQIQLVAHCRGIGVKEAAEWLSGTSTRTVVPDTSTSTVRKDHASGFEPLDYLEADHAAVEALGFDLEVAMAVGIGYSPKGILRGTVAIPVRLEDGRLIGYLGLTENPKLPQKWHLERKVVPLVPKKSA